MLTSVSAPARARAGVLAMVALFLAISAWWIAADSSILDFDSGRHVFNTWAMRDALGDGDLLAPWTLDNLNSYPPLLYLVGSAGMLFGGFDGIDSAMLAMNLVFVPLLAFGCWTAARIAYGDVAGALAAVFALGTPMVVSTFHVYMLDVPQTAAVAATVGAVLASRRFERVGMSALAGAAGAAAMLLKPTSAVFLGGFLAVVFLRGGWRHWRGLLVFALVVAVPAAPWYLDQLDTVGGLTSSVSAAPSAGGGGTNVVSYLRPARWSEENFAWYAWNLLNLQLLAPLFLAFVAGTAVAVVRFARRRDPADPTPELLIGGLVAYLGMTLVSLKDPRYSLPALVYVAVLGVAWVPALRGRVRTVAAGALVAVAVVNLVSISFGIGSRIAVKGPNAPPTMLGERSVRIYGPEGYLQNQPRDDSDALRVMRDVRAAGFGKMEFDPGGGTTFSVTGLQVLLRIAGLQQPPRYEPQNLDADTVFMLRHAVPPGGPQPCGRLAGDWGLYLVRGPGSVVLPFEQYDLYCPPRR